MCVCFISRGDKGETSVGREGKARQVLNRPSREFKWDSIMCVCVCVCVCVSVKVLGQAWEGKGVRLTVN